MSGKEAIVIRRRAIRPLSASLAGCSDRPELPATQGRRLRPASARLRVRGFVTACVRKAESARWLDGGPSGGRAGAPGTLAICSDSCEGATGPRFSLCSRAVGVWGRAGSRWIAGKTGCRVDCVGDLDGVAQRRYPARDIGSGSVRRTVCKAASWCLACPGGKPAVWLLVSWLVRMTAVGFEA